MKSKYHHNLPHYCISAPLRSAHKQYTENTSPSSAVRLGTITPTACRNLLSDIRSSASLSSNLLQRCWLPRVLTLETLNFTVTSKTNWQSSSNNQRTSAVYRQDQDFLSAEEVSLRNEPCPLNLGQLHPRQIHPTWIQTSQQDQRLYFNQRDNQFISLVLVTDDRAFASNDCDLLEWFKRLLSKTFKVKLLDHLRMFIGWGFTYSRHGT